MEDLFLDAFSERKCLFAQARNCGDGLSGEHIVSASILREFGTEKIRVSANIGGRDFSRVVSSKSDSIKVRRLCRRHNSALGPLDTEACRLFRSIHNINIALNSGTPNHLRILLFNGFDIERWMLKTLLAVFYGRQTRIEPEHFVLPEYVLDLLYSPLPRPYGLYIPLIRNRSQLHSILLERTVSIRLYAEGPLVTGVYVSLGGLEMTLVIGGNLQAIDSLASISSYRPKMLNFFKVRDVYTIAFAWSDGTDNVVWCTADPLSPLPSDE